MDFQLSEDQVALRAGIRSFCDGRISIDDLRALEKQGFDRALWRELAEMGVFSLRQREAAGGVGLGSADAVIVFAELGRCLAPGPLVWSHLAADLVPGAGAGEVVVGGVEQLQAGDLVLVEHLEQLDALLVLRRDGVYRVDPQSLSARSTGTSLDPFTPIHRVHALPAGERIADAAAAALLRLEGGALAAGMLLGIAERTQEIATEYAKKREQFDRPIGSFQAIKHILADCYTRQEIARAAAYAAGATLDDPAVGSAARAVATAKVIAGDAAMKNARACIQVHGGMGYTWEIPAHYYLKRVWVLENAFGDGAEHAEQMAEIIAAS
ncbi:MAG TPA: acyl-CoA dehydrogenase family protein [Myxococcota bacterium]|nr:acyl-CoA dehydrogenase family protein [Myxococcota bacterium]